MRDVETLIEALPYIRQFRGKTVVIKYGGAAMTEEHLKEGFARDIVLLKYVGLDPIVVHGGGPEVTTHMQKLDMPVEFRDGLRVSDGATVEVARMVLVGKVNQDIVSNINQHGQPAVGLSGEDGRLLMASRKSADDGGDIGQVGTIERVDVDLIRHVADDYVPVVASIATDEHGTPYNVNADEVASAIARAIDAEKLIYLTDVAGWLSNASNPDSIVRQAQAVEVESALESIEGGMRPKLESCVAAIQGGVRAAHIIDGRVPHSLLLELFTDDGIGTKIGPSS